MNSHNNNQRKRRSGFALLFAVVLTSVILSIALGLAKVAIKEITFSSSAKATNDAFFAADTGAECALYFDLSGSASAFGVPIDIYNPSLVECAGTSIDLSGSSPWEFHLYGLGSTGDACARVNVEKIGGSTTIISKGFSVGGKFINCDSTSYNRVERQIEVNY